MSQDQYSLLQGVLFVFFIYQEKNKFLIRVFQLIQKKTNFLENSSI